MKSVLIVLALGLGVQANSDRQSSKEALATCKSIEGADASRDTLKKCVYKMMHGKDSGEEDNSCNDIYKTVSEAKKDTLEVCSGFAAGSLPSCQKKIESCSPDTSAEGSGNTISTILSSLGMPSLKSFNNKCPQFTSDKLEDRIQQIEDTLKESTEKMAKLQESLQEQQKEVQQKQLEAEQQRISAENEIAQGEIGHIAEQREIAANSVTEQHSLERDIDRAHERMLRAQSQMAQAIQEKNRNLLQLKRNCDAVLAENKAKYEAEMQAMRSSGQHIQGGLEAPERMRQYYERKLKKVYSNCIREARKDRVLLINSSGEQTKLARQQMRQAQDEMNRIKDAINVRRARAQQEIAEKQTRTAVLKQQKQKEVELAYKNANAALQAVQQMQTQVNQQLQTEQQNQMMAKIQLASLKAQKSSKEITETPETVRGSLSNLKLEAENFKSMCCKGDKQHKACKGSIKRYADINVGEESDDGGLN